MKLLFVSIVYTALLETWVTFRASFRIMDKSNWIHSIFDIGVIQDKAIGGYIISFFTDSLSAVLLFEVIVYISAHPTTLIGQVICILEDIIVSH